MNGSNWTDRYPRIIEEAVRIQGSAILDAEVVCLDDKGVPQFDTLHSRTADTSGRLRLRPIDAGR